MTVTVQFLHSRPQKEIASLVHQELGRCLSAEIVSGFVTPDGVEALRGVSHARKIQRLVIGAGTFKAFEAMDKLINAGLQAAAVRVHLGHTRATGGKSNPFARYRPMLHSKIYLFKLPDGMSSAFVGSHNLTGFALRGLNGEAGVLLQGASTESVFAEIETHILNSYGQAVPYDSSLKAAYAQWLREYLDALGSDATDMPRDSDGRRTVILFAVAPVGRLPQVGERIYFELDRRLTEVNSINTEVHLHLFKSMPSNPAEALARSGTSDIALTSKVEAIDVAAGSAEVTADWSIDDPIKPVLNPVTPPFRPRLKPGNQQVRAHVVGPLTSNFDYLFDSGKEKWIPEFGGEQIYDEQTKHNWIAVTGLRRDLDDQTKLVLMERDLKEISPQSGSFVLYSQRRRKLGSRTK